MNILKPPALSSHDVVNAARKILKVKRIGHAGTLDPAAAGVLPLAVGRATAFLQYLPDDKAYRAQVRFGVATDSGDETGEVTASCDDFVMPRYDDIKKVLGEFVGHITQTPPLHSAIKIDGRRAYSLLRHESDAVMPSREVFIRKISLLDVCGNTFFIDVECSKGTYIRSLAMDIGKKFSLPTVMSFLVRTRVGAFNLSNAYTLEELASAGHELLISPEDYLTQNPHGFGDIPRFQLSPQREKAFCHGLSTHLRTVLSPRVLVYVGDKFLGLGRFDEDEKALCPLKIYRI